MVSSRADLVAAAGKIIAGGSQSFAAASRLFPRELRERVWLLYAWCRAADDLTDGQDLGHGASRIGDPEEVQVRLEAMTASALYGDDPVPQPFEALRVVARETRLPRGLVDDFLAGFALDAQRWRPRTEDDLLRYCYHVAGSVGCMMGVVMGIDPDDNDTLDRACDLGIAFQLVNIARDVVPDAEVGRCYLPAEWNAAAGVAPQDLALPGARGAVAVLAARLVSLSQAYRRSARAGAARLPLRSRLAVFGADAVYGAIGERVVAAGPRAWERRVSVGSAAKARLIALAALRCLGGGDHAPRTGLWTRPRQS